MTKLVAAAEFLEHADALLQEAENGEEIIVTKDGEEIARLMPFVPRRGVMHGTFEIVGDIMEPIDVEWDCMK